MPEASPAETGNAIKTTLLDILKNRETSRALMIMATTHTSRGGASVTSTSQGEDYLAFPCAEPLSMKRQVERLLENLGVDASRFRIHLDYARPDAHRTIELHVDGDVGFSDLIDRAKNFAHLLSVITSSQKTGPAALQILANPTSLENLQDRELTIRNLQGGWQDFAANLKREGVEIEIIRNDGFDLGTFKITSGFDKLTELRQLINEAMPPQLIPGDRT